MELMCIKRRHENGCMWPFEGYSPILVVHVCNQRLVNSYCNSSSLPFICKLIENFMYCIFSFSFLLIHTHTYTHTHSHYCAICVKINIDVALLDLQGPIFVHEPPHKIEFSNNTGGHIHCSGHANPYPEVISFFKSKILFMRMEVHK